MTLPYAESLLCCVHCPHRNAPKFPAQFISPIPRSEPKQQRAQPHTEHRLLRVYPCYPMQSPTPAQTGPTCPSMSGFASTAAVPPPAAPPAFSSAKRRTFFACLPSCTTSRPAPASPSAGTPSGSVAAAANPKSTEARFAEQGRDLVRRALVAITGDNSTAIPCTAAVNQRQTAVRM